MYHFQRRFFLEGTEFVFMARIERGWIEEIEYHCVLTSGFELPVAAAAFGELLPKVMHAVEAACDANDVAGAFPDLEWKSVGR